MLRSFDEISASAAPNRIVAEGRGRSVLLGGGRTSYRTPPHWHDCIMILLPQAGALDFRDEARRSGAWLSEDRFVLVPKGRVHQTAAIREGHRHFAIYVADAGLQALERGVGHVNAIRRAQTPLMFSATAAMRSLQRLCVRSGEENARGSDAIRAHLADALLLQCVTQIETTPPLSPAAAATHADAIVGEMEAFLRDHAMDHVALDEIADRFNLSRRHATRLFRAKTGQSIAAYQEKIRLQVGLRLLLETTLPIGEIAFRAGYESGSALARALRRRLGQSPSTLRKGMSREDTSFGPTGRAPRHDLG